MKQTRELQHPLHQVPAVAQVVGYYVKNGRNVGEELQFCDGHRCKLTYAEITKLQQAVAIAVNEQPPLPSDGMTAEEIDAAVKEMGARRPYIIEKRPYTPPAIIEERAMPGANSQQPATNGRAVQVADGFDRLISLGRLARELQAAGVQVALSGEINIKIKFNGGE